MFIVFEGVEGSGKTTQARRLAEWLESRGLSVVLTREPGGTEVGERVRELLLDRGALGAEAELFLLLAARSELVREVVRPALAAGRVVIADRYSLSTLAYQIAGRGLAEAEVRRADELARGGLWPDLTVVLEVPGEVSEARRSQRTADRIEAAGEAFHARVAAAYRRLAGTEPAVATVDARGDAEAVQRVVRVLLAVRFPETFANGPG